MAINKTVNKRTNTHGAMRNCIEYVLQEKKIDRNLVTVTGPYAYDDINYDLVYQTFLREKRLWNKDSGRMYAHNIISWHKDEKITPEEAFQFGLEFAEKWFSGFQTLISVHQDKDHIHCHLVTNSVNYENGKKLHTSKKDLERMKQMTNQMCRTRGLTVAEKGKHFNGTAMETGEVVIGIVIGADRSKKRRGAGIKTHTLVCLSSALVMMTGEYIQRNFVGTMDVARLGAQVISGVGFLGVGTIIVTGHQQIKGLTTAAGLWACACLGLAAGIGFVEGSLVTLLLILGTLKFLSRLDNWLHMNSKVFDLYVEFATNKDVSQFVHVVREMDAKIDSMELGKSKIKGGGPNAIVHIEMLNGSRSMHFLNTIRCMEGITYVEEL